MDITDGETIDFKGFPLCGIAMQVNNLDADQIAQVLLQFQKFLIESWPTLQTILANHDWDEDAYFFQEWLDQNWNLLVGRRLFGKGANIQPFCVGMNDIRKESSGDASDQRFPSWEPS